MVQDWIAWEELGDVAPCGMEILNEKLLNKCVSYKYWWAVRCYSQRCFVLCWESNPRAAVLQFLSTQLCLSSARGKWMMLHSLTRPCPGGMELGAWTDRGSSSQNELEWLILVAEVWNTEFLEKEEATMLSKHSSLQSWLQKEHCIFIFFSFFFLICCSKYLNVACEGKKRNTNPTKKHN